MIPTDWTPVHRADGEQVGWLAPDGGPGRAVPLLLTGLMNGVMWFLGGIFVLIWLYLLQVRKELLGSPFGAPTRRD